MKTLAEEREAIVESMRTTPCRDCGGGGYTVEYDPRDQTGQTPRQVQCDYCHAEGVYTTLDEVRTLLSSRDTYWKEREAKKDDLLDDMWGLICNVNGGIVEDEKPDWCEAFFRIREKYFKQITPINEDNLK